jgi:hypothetical protein
MIGSVFMTSLCKTYAEKFLVATQTVGQGVSISTLIASNRFNTDIITSWIL